MSERATPHIAEAKSDDSPEVAVEELERLLPADDTPEEEEGPPHLLVDDDLANVSTNRELLALLRQRGFSTKKAVSTLRYEVELEKLQIELVRLQRNVQLKGKRVAIVFEGRDAAGKGGTIRRFIEHLNPRTAPSSSR
jgi:hypothetical protein